MTVAYVPYSLDSRFFFIALREDQSCRRWTYSVVALPKLSPDLLHFPLPPSGNLSFWGGFDSVMLSAKERMSF